MMCKVGGCDRIIDRHGAKGMCHSCYERNRKKSPEAKKKTIITRKKWFDGLAIEQKERMKRIGKSNRSKRRKEYKTEVVNHYTNNTNDCSCCGETNFEFLCVDHINGDGGKQRKKMGSGGSGVQFYLWLMKNNFPDGYRILCYNCNCSLGFLGYCPHDMS